MDQTTLLLEYLKHHWSERSFHQTGEINATAFLTGAAGLVLSFAFKEGISSPNTLASGIIVFLIGIANWRINKAYFLGNRYRNEASGRTRRALEKAIQNWTVETPTEIRRAILQEEGLKSDISLGKKIHSALIAIPITTMIIGILVAIASGLHFRLGTFAT